MIEIASANKELTFFTNETILLVRSIQPEEDEDSFYYEFLAAYFYHIPVEQLKALI